MAVIELVDRNPEAKKIDKPKKIETKEITFALSKGRIFDETLPILRTVRMEPIENFTESNQFEVRQNAGDDNSPLTCDPECPQEEYVYDYQYAGSANSQVKFI